MQTPEKGFYYHYKHDPNGSFDNYAYEVLNIGHHTESMDSMHQRWLCIDHFMKLLGYMELVNIGMFDHSGCLWKWSRRTARRSKDSRKSLIRK